MRTDILAKRNAIATDRIGEAMAELAAQHDIGEDAVSAYQQATHRDRAIAGMRRNEAVADFLDALNGAQVRTPANNASEDVLARLTAIPGIGEAKAKQVLAALEGE